MIPVQGQIRIALVEPGLTGIHFLPFMVWAGRIKEQIESDEDESVYEQETTEPKFCHKVSIRKD